MGGRAKAGRTRKRSAPSGMAPAAGLRYRGAAMPELPEVETIRRGLAASLEGRRLKRVIQRRPDLRQAMPARLAQRLQGRRVLRLDPPAQYLLPPPAHRPPPLLLPPP